MFPSLREIPGAEDDNRPEALLAAVCAAPAKVIVAAGALGGKLLGAGGGGFLVFYVQPERQDAVRWAMRDLMHIPFAFEDGGTRVIHYTPEAYEPNM